jgi:hypothetical protein
LPIGPNGLEARIGGDHLPYLVRQFLPVANEVARVIVRHCFGAFFFQNCDYSKGIGAILWRLPAGNRKERARNA